MKSSTCAVRLLETTHCCSRSERAYKCFGKIFLILNPSFPALYVSYSYTSPCNGSVGVRTLKKSQIGGNAG